MSFLRPARHSDDSQRFYLFWCPACDGAHHVRITKPREVSAPLWDFNGDFEKPTFTPSVRVSGYPAIKGAPRIPMCHFFVTDGKIVYCSDCEHDMAGKTVDMVDWDKVTAPQAVTQAASDDVNLPDN